MPDVVREPFSGLGLIRSTGEFGIVPKTKRIHIVCVDRERKAALIRLLESYMLSQIYRNT